MSQTYEELIEEDKRFFAHYQSPVMHAAEEFVRDESDENLARLRTYCASLRKARFRLARKRNPQLAHLYPEE